VILNTSKTSLSPSTPESSAIQKEAFALEVLDRYFAGTKQFVKEALDDKSLTPRQRLKRYLDIISGVAADRKWNLGCLIGDFSLETSTQSKLLRRRLEAIFEEWRAPFASCIAEATRQHWAWP
jgi:TetR/AcrR family transcriptional repressor of nem operon